MCCYYEHGTSPRRSVTGLRLRLNANLLLASAFVFCLVGSVRSDSPKPAEFPELAAAWRPLEKSISTTVVVGKGTPPASPETAWECKPFPSEARILAFEENQHFLYAVAAASDALAPKQPGDSSPKPAVFVRRFLLLKPSMFVIDDVLRPSAPDRPVRCSIRSRQPGALAGGKLTVKAEEQELLCETLTDQGASTTQDTNAAEHESATEVRRIHVLQIRPVGSPQPAARSTADHKDGLYQLTITTAERKFRLTLPAPVEDAGWVTIEAADGKSLVEARPLPLGVLPHGPEGMKLIDRWDSAYRGGQRPGWDPGVVAPDLKQAVEQGVLKPCRVVDLGCGSGVNCIYLAQKGFEVSGLDIAPTALGIAEANAKKAGVRVRWVLADVLAVPDLKPFDLVFDRGCYHNVRYVNATAFVSSLRRLCHPGTRCLILSCNRDGPPGVREQTMRDDFSQWFDFEWLRESDIRTGQEGQIRRPGWSVMLRSK